jgi:hypothetical protein
MRRNDKALGERFRPYRMLVNRTACRPERCASFRGKAVGEANNSSRKAGRRATPSLISIDKQNLLLINLGAALVGGRRDRTVQVAAAASMMQTEDQSISQVIDRRRTIDLPLNDNGFAKARTRRMICSIT